MERRDKEEEEVGWSNQQCWSNNVGPTMFVRQSPEGNRRSIMTQCQLANKNCTSVFENNTGAKHIFFGAKNVFFGAKMLSLGQNVHIRIAAINEKVSLLPQISMHVRRLALTQFSDKVDTSHL